MRSVSGGGTGISPGQPLTSTRTALPACARRRSTAGGQAVSTWLANSTMRLRTAGSQRSWKGKSMGAIVGGAHAFGVTTGAFRLSERAGNAARSAAASSSRSPRAVAVGVQFDRVQVARARPSGGAASRRRCSRRRRAAGEAVDAGVVLPRREPRAQHLVEAERQRRRASGRDRASNSPAPAGGPSRGARRCDAAPRAAASARPRAHARGPARAGAAAGTPATRRRSTRRLNSSIVTRRSR